jgi:hypothetical protein
MRGNILPLKNVVRISNENKVKTKDTEAGVCWEAHKSDMQRKLKLNGSYLFILD